MSTKRIGIFINTPGQVHFYKNIVKGLEHDGHKVFIVARNHRITYELLDEMNIPYYPYSSTDDKVSTVKTFPADVAKAHTILKDKKLDLITGFGIYSTFTAFLLRVPDITFSDTEPMVYPASYSVPFNFSMQLTHSLVTPSSYRQDLGKKQVVVESYKELAYLHPNHFQPNPDVLEKLGLRESEYVLLRFNALSAVHDVGTTGFSDDDKIRLVTELEKQNHVLLSSDAGVPDKIKDRVMKIPKHLVHDVIYYARLVVTDTGTMTTESAVLGTPTIRQITFQDEDTGNMVELEEKYGLLLNFRDQSEAISKAVELAQQQDLKARWRLKRERLLNDKIDMALFMVWFIENYPASFEKMKRNPEVQRVLRPDVTILA